jgi:hypothetical protein
MMRKLLLLLALAGCNDSGVTTALTNAVTHAATYGAAAARLDCMFNMNATGPSSDEFVIYREVRFSDGSGIGELTVDGLGFVSKYSARGRGPSTVFLNEGGPPNQVGVTTWHNDGALHLYTADDGGYTRTMTGICTGDNLSVFGI